MNTKRLFLLIPILIGAIVLFIDTKKETFISNEGYIFGTTYHISYSSPEGIDYSDSLRAELMNVVDQSLSTFNKTSTISLVNQNKAHTTGPAFEKVINTGNHISEMTNGAFDLTVAPLVNLWGFGYTKKTDILPTEEEIQQVLQSVGYNKISLENHTLIKQYQETKLDASAIAKGFGVDVAAEYLIKHNITNFMVEIGGEIRVGGKNKNDLNWRLGIDKPIDDIAATHRELDTVLYITDKAVATSGNYRQFYIKDGKRYSHTVDPISGYPVDHSLLSATVIANDCMTADAIATACMVMGVEKSLKIAETQEDVEIYLIVDEAGQYKEHYSKGLTKYLDPEK